MTQAREVEVTGRVQNVGFRAWVRDTARDLGVGGWVRNRSDGTVVAHLEGSAEAVEAMLDRLREGPSAARVDGVEARAAEPAGLSELSIRG